MCSTILVVKLEEMRRLEKPRYSWEYTINVYLKAVRYEMGSCGCGQG
jgi:hypothetical protein